MPWSTSNRRASLPPDWAQRRKLCITRAGGQCEHRDSRGKRCPQPATDADHRTDRMNHDDLQALCSDHHKQKTQREARAAQHAKYTAAKKRAPEPHPGIRTRGPSITTQGGPPFASPS
jgi:hypothetical protein